MILVYEVKCGKMQGYAFTKIEFDHKFYMTDYCENEIVIKERRLEIDLGVNV